MPWRCQCQLQRSQSDSRLKRPTEIEDQKDDRCLRLLYCVPTVSFGDKTTNHTAKQNKRKQAIRCSVMCEMGGREGGRIEQNNATLFNNEYVCALD